MGVIIGSATVVTVDGKRDGIQSVSWSVDVSTQRMWQLGSWTPYRTQVTKTYTCSVTTYASVLNVVFLQAATGCTDSTAVKPISIIANACANVPTGAGTFNPGNMYITSYSYSKQDPISYATETWNFQKWVDAGIADNDAQFINTPAPSVVIQGITEGSYSGDVTYVGVTPAAGYSITGTQGSVSAGFPGLGNLDETTYCIISRVGQGSLGNVSNDQGKIGQSQANIPHQPLYIAV